MISCTCSTLNRHDMIVLLCAACLSLCNPSCPQPFSSNSLRQFRRSENVSQCAADSSISSTARRPKSVPSAALCLRSAGNNSNAQTHSRSYAERHPVAISPTTCHESGAGSNALAGSPSQTGGTATQKKGGSCPNNTDKRWRNEENHVRNNGRNDHSKVPVNTFAKTLLEIIGTKKALLFKANKNYQYDKTQDVLNLLVESIIEMQRNEYVKLLDNSPGTGFTDPSWNTFLCLKKNNNTGKIHLAKVHVFSDSVSCLGKQAMNDPLTTWERKAQNKRTGL